jgi:predicted Zn-dependent protease with MMP-like domain
MDNDGQNFDAMVAAALAKIPEPFASQLGSVAIVIDDESFPPLFGLYQGVPRTTYGAENAAVPNKITIFQRVLERHYPPGPGLARAVDDVVFHEVAHHFGISDERLRELQGERQAR